MIIKILWIHKKMNNIQSKICGSIKKKRYFHQNFMDPYNFDSIPTKILWIHKI